MSMNFPRRPTPSMRRPVIESMKRSGSGWRTIAGNRSSQWTMVRPTRCGRRSATMVSTSGNSGTTSLPLAPHPVGSSPPRSAGEWGDTQSSNANHGELSHVRPVRTDLRLHLNTRLELVRAGHDSRHRLGKAVDLTLGHLEEKLVVHLEQHPTFDVIGLDLTLQLHHRDLDDVRGQGLHRKVDGHPFGRAAQLKVGGP